MYTPSSEAEASVLALDKADFRARNITRDTKDIT